MRVEHEELKILLLAHFETFSVKLSGHTCKVKGELDSFLKQLSKTYDVGSLGSWFAWNYVAFQFEYYRTLKTKMDGKYPANWIFGKKAVERWLNRDMETWSFHVQNFLYEAEIDPPEDFCEVTSTDMFEVERKRYLNTDTGLAHCLQFARPSSKSPSCIICRNKKDCWLLWK